MSVNQASYDCFTPSLATTRLSRAPGCDSDDVTRDYWEVFTNGRHTPLARIEFCSMPARPSGREPRKEESSRVWLFL